MLNIIHEAGWGAYPVILFGVSAIVMAVRHLVSPSTKHQITTKWLMGLTVLAGVLGTATGVQASAQSIANVGADERWVFLFGLYESLHNLTMALVLVTLAMLGLLGAHLRQSPDPVAPLPAE